MSSKWAGLRHTYGGLLGGLTGRHFGQLSSLLLKEKSAFVVRPDNRTLLSNPDRGIDVRRLTPSRVLELSARATVKTRPMVSKEPDRLAERDDFMS